MTKVVSRQLSQEVCPQLAEVRAAQQRGGVLAAAGRARREAHRADVNGPGGVLAAIQELTREAHQAAGAARNVAVALGNWGSPEAVPVLAQALIDEEPLIRGHAAWALGWIAWQVDDPNLSLQVASIRGERLGEPDEWVRQEIRLLYRSVKANAGRSP